MKNLNRIMQFHFSFCYCFLDWFEFRALVVRLVDMGRINEGISRNPF